ncbi:MAG: hypothetical protein HN428_03890 [Proteobacteria bacterium]|nr:hypothetical protein [Pseudomonadota bacterium]
MAISRTDGFVDLRVSPMVSGRSDEDSVWPSFTDIMTVVVLIFLVALVVILMRNTELVGQLRESVTETETMTSQRGQMEMRMASLGDEVVRLRSILEQSEAERSAAEQTIALKEGEISSLLNDVGALQKMRDALAGEKASLGEQLAAVKEERKQLTGEKAALSDELTEVTSARKQLSEEKTALLATQQELEAELASLEQDRTTLQATRASLQTEVAGLIATREQLTGEKVALSDELAGAVAEGVIQQEQLTESEGLREQLALDLTDLNSALISLQAEQSRLILAYETQAQGQAGVTNARNALLQERNALADQINALEVTRGSLRAEVSVLREEMSGLVRSMVSAERALEESQLVGEELTARLAETALEYKLTKEELAYLRAEYTDEVAAFAKERELLAATHKEELNILRERHSDLESKYNRLVRPARSTAGRFVVEVRFWKEGDLRRYSLRQGGGVETSVSESELHQQLTTMKAHHGDKLYTKVMPDDNSLTHGEAWRFTTKILNRYDYYYQN